MDRIVFGGRRVGKTAILKHLLEEGKKYPTALFDEVADLNSPTTTLKIGADEVLVVNGKIASVRKPDEYYRQPGQAGKCWPPNKISQKGRRKRARQRG